MCYLSINVSLNMIICIFARIQSKHNNFSEKNFSQHFVGSHAFRNYSFLCNQSQSSLSMLFKLSYLTIFQVQKSICRLYVNNKAKILVHVVAKSELYLQHQKLKTKNIFRKTNCRMLVSHQLGQYFFLLFRVG